MHKLLWFPVNCCYGWIFGRTVETASVIRLFPGMTRAEVLDDLALDNLTADKDGTIHAA